MAGAGGTEVGRISIKVVPDTDGFRAALRRQLEQARQGLDDDVDIDINLNTAGLIAAFRALIAQLESMGRVDIETEIRRDALSRARELARFQQQMQRDQLNFNQRNFLQQQAFQQRMALSRLREEQRIAAEQRAEQRRQERGGGSGGSRSSSMWRKLIPNFGGDMNLSAMTIIIGGLMALLAPLTALLTTALLSLPGLIAAVAVPIAALALGMDGLKKAATVLKTPLESLKKVMSSSAEQMFGPVFERLASSKVWSVLEAKLPRVTEGLASMASAFVDAVSSDKSLNMISSTISNIGKALSQMAPGIQSFTNGFLQLIQQFSAKLPAFAEWFNNAGKSFETWIQKLSGGQLSNAFDQLGTTLKTILDFLGQIAIKGMEFLAENPQGMQDFLNSLKLIAESLPGLVDASSQLITWIRDAIVGFQAFGDAIMIAANPIGFLIDLFDQITGKLTGLSGLFSGLNFGDSLRNAFSGFSGIGTEAINGLISAITGALPGVDTILGGLKDKIVNAIPNPAGLLTAAGSAIIGGLISGIQSRLPSLFGIISGIAPKIASLKGPLPYDRKLLIPNGLAIMFGLEKGIEQGTVPVLAKAQALARQIADAVAKGADASKLISGMNKTDVSGAQKALATESERLGNQLKALEYQQKMAGKDINKGEIDRLKKLKEQIDAQKEMVGLAGDYNKETSKGSDEDPLVKAASRLAKTPLDFGKAVGKQFLTDIGISGDGLIPNLLEEGMQYIFQVGSVDEALSAHNNLLNRKALQFR